MDPTLPEAEEALPADLDAQAVLAGAAASPEPSLRARALGLLIRHSSAGGGGEWGPRALWDPSPWVQRAGIEALQARLPEAASIELLEGYVQREGLDPYVRARAALALGPASQAARHGIDQAWQAADLPWERAPLALAAALFGDPSAIAALAEALSTGEIALDVDFVLTVGRSGLTDLLPALAEGAEYVEEELRLPFAVARVELGDPSGEQVLRRALSSPNEELRLEALDYISRMEGPTADALLRRARGSGPDLVRWYAELALAARGAGPADLWERAMGEPDHEVRALGVRFAAEAGRSRPGDRRTARSLRRVLLQALDDLDPGVRIAALQAAAAVEGEDLQALLLSNLRHPQEGVRVEAAGALLARGPR